MTVYDEETESFKIVAVPMFVRFIFEGKSGHKSTLEVLGKYLYFVVFHVNET